VTDLAFYDYGSATAPTVVLLHSIATSSAMWDLQVPLWRQRFRVLTVDLPGHGASPLIGAPTLAGMAEAVVAVLDGARVERAAFVGLSLGGMVCQAIALNQPSRVAALVLANTTGRVPPEARGLWDRRIADVEAGGMETQVATTLERWFTPRFRETSPLTVAFVAHLIRSTSPAGFIAAGRAIQSLDFLDALSAITRPTMVVSGSYDTGTPPTAGAALAEKIPGARLEIIEAAHMSALEKPIEFAELIGGFLRDSL